MQLPLTERTASWLTRHNFKLRLNREDVPRGIFLELTGKEILVRGRRLNEFVLSPTGRIIHEDLCKNAGKEYVYEERWHKRQSRNNDEKYTKLYPHYVPGSQKGYICKIKCVGCSTIEECPVQSLFQKKWCHRCVLDGRARRKQETRHAQSNTQ